MECMLSILLLLFDMCEGLSKASIKAECPIHRLVTRGAAYG